MYNISLEIPNIIYKDEAKKFVNDHFNNNEKIIHGGSGINVIKDYEKWLQILKQNSISETVQKGFVPATTFFAIRKIDKKIVGIIQIRYKLNEVLYKYGGNIGYSVAPSERGKGYGTQMLKLALSECKKLKLDKVLVSCYKDNIASQKTIIKCKGKLENEVYYSLENVYIKRFWIKV